MKKPKQRKNKTTYNIVLPSYNKSSGLKVDDNNA